MIYKYYDDWMIMITISIYIQDDPLRGAAHPLFMLKFCFIKILIFKNVYINLSTHRVFVTLKEYPMAISTFVFQMVTPFFYIMQIIIHIENCA